MSHPLDRVACAISNLDLVTNTSRAQAARAIAALREPTGAMISAMNWNGDDAATMWRAAIDAALSDNGTERV